ncbi:MAG: 30S ribosomal protein S9 [bacterium]|nr:30S ribosomal protein S9 [bacterium]
MPKKTTSETAPAPKKPAAKKPAKKAAVKKALPVSESVIETASPEEPITMETAPKPAQPKASKVAAVQPVPKPKAEKFFETVGRRKRAVARVRLYTSNPQNSAEAGGFLVNGRALKAYFTVERYWLTAEDALRKLKSLNRFRITAMVAGGGMRAQSEAVRHGVARALVKFDLNFRKRLKRAGFLTRDPREKERKKYGLKKARRRPQWAKR